MTKYFLHVGCIPFHPEPEHIYLEVDLLCEGGLGGQGSIDCLLEWEGEERGDPGVSRGAHLSRFRG